MILVIFYEKVMKNHDIGRGHPMLMIDNHLVVHDSEASSRVSARYAHDYIPATASWLEKKLA